MNNTTPVESNESAASAPNRDENLEQLLEAYADLISNDFHQALRERRSASILIEKLRQVHPAKDIHTENDILEWSRIATFHMNQSRFREALWILNALYDQMLLAQKIHQKRIHKGTPLCWMADCYSHLGFHVHAKRYLMLTLCEDAIETSNQIEPNNTGSYIRLVWRYGLTDSDFSRYASEICALTDTDHAAKCYPEWSLQQLDQDWMTEYPSPIEAYTYRTNTHYVNYLRSRLGEPTGKSLELLAEYLIRCMPGCRTSRRVRTPSTDHDLICSLEGLEMDFRSELGRYFLCECKDWAEAADFTTIAKFCRVLISTKSRFGILFSRQGLSGEDSTKVENGERERQKLFNEAGIVIVVVDDSDLQAVEDGRNFVSLLRKKYEKMRLDLV